MRYTAYFALTPAVSAVTRLNHLRVVVAVAFACGMLISPKLWFGIGRTFPRAPLVSGLPAFLSSADYLFSILLLAALALAVASTRPGRYLAAGVILTGLLAVLDQTRVQPWVYQYLVMMAVLASRGRATADPESGGPILAGSQLVIAALYFWSGMQKLNWSFGHEVLPAFLDASSVGLPVVFVPYVSVAGVGIAVCEALIGVGLLISRTRRAAVLFALGMHLLVLLMLVLAWRNSVVLPWNIGMTVMVVVLFWRLDHPPPWQELKRWRGTSLMSQAPKAVIVVCGLAPALSFAGWWDMYLSAALYSGNVPVAVIRISSEARGRLPISAQQHVFKTQRGELMLPFYEWSLGELNVPPYPESRVYRQLARQVCGYVENQQEIELIIRERPSLIDGSYAVTRADCQDLSAR